MHVLINFTFITLLIAFAASTPLASDRKNVNLGKDGTAINHIGPIPFDAGLLASLTEAMQAAGVVNSGSSKSAQGQSADTVRWGCRPCCYTCGNTICCGVCCDGK